MGIPDEIVVKKIAGEEEEEEEEKEEEKEITNSVDDFQWAQQRLRKGGVFKNATLNDKEQFAEEYSSRCSSKQGFLLSAIDFNIDKVPLCILQVMFEKAALIQTDALVFPNPWSSVVAVTCNRTFCLTPSKEGTLTCDSTCINSTTNICDYVSAVAENVANCLIVVSGSRGQSRDLQ